MIAVVQMYDGVVYHHPYSGDFYDLLDYYDLIKRHSKIVDIYDPFDSVAIAKYKERRFSKL